MTGHAVRAQPRSAVVDGHIGRLRREGLTQIRGAIPNGLLHRCRKRFKVLLDAVGEYRQGVPMAREVKRILELDICFAALMDRPEVFAVVQRWFDGKATLGDGGIAQAFSCNSLAQGGWHRDGGAWLRATFLLDDLEELRGPTAFIPYTHWHPDDPPAEWNDAAGQPRAQPGECYGTGSAGDCILNVSSIWHTSTPNRSESERYLVWLLYKPRSDAPWDTMGLGYAMTESFAASQTDARRRNLCGLPPKVV